MHPSWNTIVPGALSSETVLGSRKASVPGKLHTPAPVSSSELDCRAPSNTPMNPGIRIFQGRLSILIRVVKHSMVR